MKDIERNIVLKIRSGSHLYGTNTPESDEDFLGIFMPSEEYVFGTEIIKEVDKSTVVKDKNGKNTSEAIDCKYYEFRNFIRLARQGNPNIIEMLFVNEKNIIFINEIGKKILKNRDLFVSQECLKRILGYSNSQKHKMLIKTENLEELYAGLDVLNIVSPKLTLAELSKSKDNEIEYEDENGNKKINTTVFFKYSKSHIKCGDLCFERGLYAKKAKRMIEKRLENASWRKEGMLKNGYDTKFALHLLRLLKEADNLLTFKRLHFPLTWNHFLRRVKKGEYPLQEVLNIADRLEKQIRKEDWNFFLPKTPAYKKIEEFTIETMKEYFNV